MKSSFDFGREILKWVALITMTIDHMGVIFYPENPYFRYIGRLSFPLFSYLLVLGFESTKSIKTYLKRLLLFGIISQVPFALVQETQFPGTLNIFFTLSLGLIFIYFIEKGNFLPTYIPIILSILIRIDYSYYGVLSVGCMYLLRKRNLLGVISLIVLNIISYYASPVQFLSLLSLLIIIPYDKNAKKNKVLKGRFSYPSWRKFFFYVYYPLHLSLFYIIKIVL